MAQTDRTRNTELPVRPEQKIGAVAHGLTDGFAERHRHRDIGHRRHVAAAHCIGARGVELNGRIALLNHCDCRLTRHFGRSPEFWQSLPRLRIQIGIGAQTIVHLPTEQCPNRPIPRLAQNVPAGDFEPGKRPNDRRIGPLRKAAGIDTAEHFFEVFWVFALHMPRKHVLDHGTHDLWPNRRGVAFPIPHDPAGRR